MHFPVCVLVSSLIGFLSFHPTQLTNLFSLLFYYNNHSQSTATPWHVVMPRMPSFCQPNPTFRVPIMPASRITLTVSSRDNQRAKFWNPMFALVMIGARMLAFMNSPWVPMATRFVVVIALCTFLKMAIGKFCIIIHPSCPNRLWRKYK